MEFWILILTAWAFYGWVQSRIRRQKDDERFARVVEALNKLEPRLKDLHKLETRVHELESRLTTAAPPTPAKQPVTPPPPSPQPKPVEPPISIKLPTSLEIPKRPSLLPLPPFLIPQRRRAPLLLQPLPRHNPRTSPRAKPPPNSRKPLAKTGSTSSASSPWSSVSRSF